MADQIHDFEAAMAAAKRLPGVGRNRIVLWGSSMSGGHVLRLAAGRDDIAAAIADDNRSPVVRRQPRRRLPRRWLPR